jgi:hypothetical protein
MMYSMRKNTTLVAASFHNNFQFSQLFISLINFNAIVIVCQMFDCRIDSIDSETAEL